MAAREPFHIVSALIAARGLSTKAMTKKLRSAILQSGSATEDNERCAVAALTCVSDNGVTLKDGQQNVVDQRALVMCALGPLFRQAERDQASTCTKSVVWPVQL